MALSIAINSVFQVFEFHSVRADLFVQVELGVCRDIRKFTSALGNLDLETKDQDHARFRTKDAQTNYFSDSEQEETAPVFKTREKSTFQLVLQGPEILNFQVRISCRLIFIRDVITRV